MTQEELMLGDWVIRKNVPDEKLTVVAINLITKLVALDLDGRGVIEDIYNIGPIPLTPEILEKNGFSLQSDNTELFKLDTYWLGSELGAFRIHNLINDWWKFGPAKIRYVHELQHALRLCGINKKIEI